MGTEQDILETMPKKYHEDYLKGQPFTFQEWLTKLADAEVLFNTVWEAYSFAEGKLPNDQNQAGAYRAMMFELENQYAWYVADWESRN